MLGLRALVTMVSSVTQARENVFLCEVRKVFKNLFLGHARSKIFQHVIHRDPHSANTRFAAALFGLDRDDVSITHFVIIKPEYRRGKVSWSQDDFFDFELLAGVVDIDPDEIAISVVI